MRSQSGRGGSDLKRLTERLWERLVGHPVLVQVLVVPEIVRFEDVDLLAGVGRGQGNLGRLNSRSGLDW